MILIRPLCASAASSRNLSSRSVASSTVMPITLISSEAAVPLDCDVTVTLEAGGLSPPPTVPRGDGCGGVSLPLISSSPPFLPPRPASLSAYHPPHLPQITAFL